MENGLAESPHFRIAEPRFDDAERLVAETRRCLMMSNDMNAMVGLPLALAPIQKLRSISYSHQRFHKFLRSWDAEFG